MKKYFYICFILVFFKLNWALAPVYTDEWVAWNVGQGLWITHVQTMSCSHYDIGGEFGSFRPLRRTLLEKCGHKENRLNLSHWHVDHFLNLSSLLKTIPNVCWQTQALKTKNQAVVQQVYDFRIPFCQTKIDLGGQVILPGEFRNVNESSIVFKDAKVLLPGDSPKRQEKIWQRSLKNLSEVQVLILGHHGSRTSTGKELLQRLPHLQFTIASARTGRYGHPHRQTVDTLKLRGIPVLKTEDWGNIWWSP